VGTGHQFLIDIAHEADPSSAPGLVRHADGTPGGVLPAGTYDGDLLDQHFIAGDGRVNENIGLTAVRSIFHHEHNRLVDQVMDTVLAQHDVAYLNQWLLTPVTAVPTTAAAIDALEWNGERLFQTAKFGTEMQYQHLVFEEFARTIQPMINPFFAPTQVYDVNLNPSIVAEFAHTVYRFGHSMLTETVDRYDANMKVVTADPLHPSTDPNQQLGLIAAFLNPQAFAASGPTPEQATGAVVRGLTRQAGNELDEFVTEALRNNLVGLPLDLATLNLARGRDVGIPSLNAARRDFYNQTGDSWVKPYNSWADLVQHIKHPESLINFIAAYGTHAELRASDVDTLVEKRAVASALVLGGSVTINASGIGGPQRTFTANSDDRFAFLNSTGIYANNATTGATTTGVDDIDFWIGGLAEQQAVFGGLLGSTFNFVFENQLQKLQDADRFYYLERTAGLSFGNELEFNSFSKLIMANTDATHLAGNAFLTPGFSLEVDQSNLAALGNQTISAQTGSDTLSGIENAIGGAGNDSLAGNGVSGTLTGGAGNDLLKDLNVVAASTARTTMIGGTGNDVYDAQQLHAGHQHRQPAVHFRRGSDQQLHRHRQCARQRHAQRGEQQ
jgi:hypothetical protein